MRVKCLAQEHNTMSPARARTRTARSGVECTNHEATAPPTRGGGIGNCEINIVAKRINPPDQQQIIIKHAYEKMLLKTFSFGTQIRTFTNSNDFLQKTYSGSFRCHSGSFRCHSTSFRSVSVFSNARAWCVEGLKHNSRSHERTE